MGQSEITIFIILVNIVLLIFIAGTIIFVLQFRRRKMEYEREKHRAAEQHQHDLLNAQLEIQHQTMQHIGSEIHDSVGQKLTLASIYANQLSYYNQYPELADKINAISNFVNESLDELRFLSKTLTQPALAQAELVELLGNESEQVNASGACHVYIQKKVPEPVLSLTVKNVLFRILQEFIQNSLKHAHCKRICITIDLDEQQQCLTIIAVDDGKGFDLSVEPKGIGLSNMDRRARQIGAAFHLQSEQGKGTTLRLSLPVEKKD
jgi:signal transduction histidine kinase